MNHWINSLLCLALIGCPARFASASTPTPLPTALNCSSWNYKPATCPLGITVTVQTDQSGDLCSHAGNYTVSSDSSGNLSLNAINGCRANFVLEPTPVKTVSPTPTPSITPTPSPSSSGAVNDGTGTIYAVSPSTGQIALASTITGQAPLSVHVSAVAPHTDSCLFDQAGWEAAGMKNLCSPNWQAWSIPASPTPLPTKSFVNDGAPGEVAATSECFHNFLTSAGYDAATTKAIDQIAACVSAGASADYGPNLFTQDFSWNFGDTGSAFNTVKGFNAAHVYYAPGTYTLTMNGKTMKVVVTPNTRTPVLVNTQADMNALVALGSLAKVSNRWIQLKRGVTFAVSGSIYLYENDWMTAQPGSGPLPVITSTSSPTSSIMLLSPAGSTFKNVLIELLDFEHQVGNSTNNPMISQIYGNATSVVFKDIVFKDVRKAFDLSGSGILIQNVGSSVPWTDVQLNSNFAIYSVTMSAFYGNNVYVGKSAGNWEPGLRANGGQLTSIIGNNLGGWIGKYDWVSMRGAQNIYFGSNTVRGGLVNTQNGVGQDPIPGILYMNGVFEDNVFDNSTLSLQQGSQNTRIDGNTFIVRNQLSQTDPYFLSYPPQQSYAMGFSGASFGIQTQNNQISDNDFLILAANQPGAAIFMGDQANTKFIGNTFYMAKNAPIQQASSLPLPQFTANTFYLQKLTDLPASLTAGNTVKLNTAFTGTIPPEGVIPAIGSEPAPTPSPSSK